MVFVVLWGMGVFVFDVFYCVVVLLVVVSFCVVVILVFVVMLLVLVVVVWGGVLFKGGVVFEVLVEVKSFFFDKIGILIIGVVEVIDFILEIFEGCMLVLFLGLEV